MVSKIIQTIYPESDGQPMADNTKQFELIVYLKKGLDLLFAHEPNVFIAGDLLWYPVQNAPKIVNAPDVMVAFNRPKGDRSSYKQWEEDNIPPQVVFEIISPSNSRQEMEKKLLFYSDYGVDEYYLYNPNTLELDGWLRDETKRLSLITEMNHWVSPRLGIEFTLSQGELEIYRPDGQKFYTYLELNQLLETEHQRANTEHQRANTEHQRAEELERLLQQYRERFGDLT